MEENKWVCERCGKEYDLEEGEGWITRVEDEETHGMGRNPSSPEPYEAVCYNCADELLGIMEECDKDCLHCDVTSEWGLSIMECLRFLTKFELIDLPKEEYRTFRAYDEAVEILRLLSGYFRRELRQ